jgi:hypothetical protein
MKICDKLFELVSDHLATLDFDGPLGLSCDDTKLHSTFRLFWDSDKQAHYLVGATDGPLLVLDPDNVKEVIESAQERKATKVTACLLALSKKILINLILGSIMVFNYPSA